MKEKVINCFKNLFVCLFKKLFGRKPLQLSLFPLKKQDVVDSTGRIEDKPKSHENLKSSVRSLKNLSLIQKAKYYKRKRKSKGKHLLHRFHFGTFRPLGW